jgi:hypothetical protein
MDFVINLRVLYYQQMEIGPWAAPDARDEEGDDGEKNPAGERAYIHKNVCEHAPVHRGNCLDRSPTTNSRPACGPLWILENLYSRERRLGECLPD